MKVILKGMFLIWVKLVMLLRLKMVTREITCFHKVRR